MLIQPNLDNITMPVNTRKNANKIKIPEKLIRFLLFFVTLYENGTFVICRTFSSRNSSIFIPPIDSTSFTFGVLRIDFISMAGSEGFLSGAGVILDLGILLIILVKTYFCTKTIGTKINIKPRQTIPMIQSFLERKPF